MAQLNRKCICCSTRYSYCPSCSRADALLPSWYAEFCSEECMNLWTTATKYNMNRLTKSEAKDIISNIKLKPTSEYVACVQKDLENIFQEEKKSKRGKRIEVNPVDDAIAIAPTLIEKITHEVVKQENE